MEVLAVAAHHRESQPAMPPPASRRQQQVAGGAGTLCRVPASRGAVALRQPAQAKQNQHRGHQFYG